MPEITDNIAEQPKPLLLIDFDSTLFRTGEFWKDIAVAMARATGKPDETYVNQYHRFTMGEGRLQLLDYDLLLATIGTDDATLTQHLQNITAGKNYLFDDAKQLLDHQDILGEQYDIGILTFGQPYYQLKKLALVPQIKHFPVHITQTYKADYIKATFNTKNGVLVDDKPGQMLPSGWIEVHVDRLTVTMYPPRQLSPNTFQITSLANLVQLLPAFAPRT